MRDALEKDVISVSSINYAEVVAYLERKQQNTSDFAQWFEDSEATLIPLDKQQAWQTGLLKAEANKLGLSLADCACLCLARQLDAVALTADAAWLNLKDNFNVEVIRHLNMSGATKE